MRRAALVLALILAGCGASAATTPAPDPGPGWTTYRSAVHALSLRFPSDWHLARRSLTPNLTDPVEVLTLATFPLAPVRPTRCAHVPEQAVRDVGPTDVLLSVLERADPSGIPGEPPHLGPPTHTEHVECAGRRAPLEEHWTTFKAHGRGFHLYVAFGPRAGAARREQVARILASLRVAPRPRHRDRQVPRPQDVARAFDTLPVRE